MSSRPGKGGSSLVYSTPTGCPKQRAVLPLSSNTSYSRTRTLNCRGGRTGPMAPARPVRVRQPPVQPAAGGVHTQVYRPEPEAVPRSHQPERTETAPHKRGCPGPAVGASGIPARPPQSGQLVQHPVAHTPDFAAINGTPVLADLVNQNEAALPGGLFCGTACPPGSLYPAGPFVQQFIQDLSPRTFSTHKSLPRLGR